jgi:hypothetical protein
LFLLSFSSFALLRGFVLERFSSFILPSPSLYPPYLLNPSPLTFNHTHTHKQIAVHPTHLLTPFTTHTYAYTPRTKQQLSTVFQLVPGAYNRVVAVITPKNVGNRRLQINVVDVDTRALISAWLVNVSAQAPAGTGRSGTCSLRVLLLAFQMCYGRFEIRVAIALRSL